MVSLSISLNKLKKEYREWEPMIGPTTIRLDLILSNLWIHILILMIHHEHQNLLWEVRIFSLGCMKRSYAWISACFLTFFTSVVPSWVTSSPTPPKQNCLMISWKVQLNLRLKLLYSLLHVHIALSSFFSSF